MDITKDIIIEFSEEVSDILEGWERCCLNLQANKDVANSLEEISRYAHNIKGTSRALQLSDLSDFIHKVEDLIEIFSIGKMPPDSETTQILFNVHQVLNLWITRACDDITFVPRTQVELITLQVDSKISSLKKSAKDGASGNEKSAHIKNIEPDKSLGHILVKKGILEQKQIDKALQIQKMKLGEILVHEGFASVDQVEVALNEQKNTAHSRSPTLRIPADKIDRLIDLLGELSIYTNMIHQAVDDEKSERKKTRKLCQMSTKLIRDVQDLSLNLRMKDLSRLFQRLERAAVDVARKQNKNISVNISGQHHELDKVLIDQISESLIHVVRNAVDHGIEPDDERIRKGKSQIGSIDIQATKDVDQVVIEVSDNGRGLNEGLIFDTAVKKGLINSDASLSASEIHQLILMPGFSTASQLTDISGRGVGMDVLKKSIEVIGGSLFIDSQVDKGSKFTINIPVTLNVMDGLLIEHEGEVYVCPIQDILEVIDIREHRVERIGAKEVIIYKNEPVNFEHIGDLLPKKFKNFELVHNKLQEDKKNCHSEVLIVQSDSKKIGVRTSGIKGQQTITVRKSVGTLSKRKGVSGTTILGNGRPGVIVNLPALVKKYFERGA